MIDISDVENFVWDGGGATIKTEASAWGARDEGDPVGELLKFRGKKTFENQTFAQNIVEGDDILTLSASAYANVVARRWFVDRLR